MIECAHAVDALGASDRVLVDGINQKPQNVRASARAGPIAQLKISRGDCLSDVALELPSEDFTDEAAIAVAGGHPPDSPARLVESRQLGHAHGFGDGRRKITLSDALARMPLSGMTWRSCLPNTATSTRTWFRQVLVTIHIT